MNGSSEQSHRARLQNAVVAIKTLQAKVDAVERAKREPIAILGAGCRIPGGANTPEAFWQLLRNGIDTVGELPADRWDVAPLLDENPYTPGRMFTRYGNYLPDVAGFDPQFFGIAPREALSLDPQQRLLLEVSWEALEHSGLAPDGLSGSRTGVFVGMSVDDYAQFHLRSGDYTRIDAYTCSGAGLCFGAGRVSYVLGLHGPSINVDTACASALTSVHLAVQSLRAEECDLALAGGINLILTPEVAIGMSALRALSPDGRCKAFDASADGFGRGEGCGMVVLKRLSSAVAAGDPILAVILGSAINHDGPSGGLMVPNGLAQEALLRDALMRSGVKAAEVQYVEAHGTGTALGDPIEMEALGAVLGEGRSAAAPLLVGSVKTNIGHLEAASGVVGLIKVALSLRQGEIPPHLHLRNPSPHIPWDRLPIAVPTKLTPWPANELRRIAGVSAFGMSGTNVHVLVADAPAVAPKHEFIDRPLHLLRLSAKNPAALRDLAAQLEQYLAEHPGVDFPDVCYTENVGRAQFPHRVALVASNAVEARTKLAAFAAGQEAQGVSSRQTERGERPKVAFLFTGQGSQYVGMGRKLYATQPTFRAALDRCDELLRPYLEQPLLPVLYPEVDGHTLLDNTAYTQPALFAFEYALAELWRSWGVEPHAVLGHSIGEYVAACIAGVFSLEDALKLVAMRGKLMQSLPTNGAMAAVFADRATVATALRPYPLEIAMAGINGPAEIVISGSARRVEAILYEFEASGVRTKRLTVSHAFHSPLIEPMLEEFRSIAAQVRHASPRIDLISNLTGGLLNVSDLEGGAYWSRHARAPVQFVAGIQTLYAQGVRAFLEIGPRPSLAGLGRQILGETPSRWLASLRKDQDEWRQMLQSLMTMHLHGVKVDWKGFDRDYPRRPVALPTYPFQRTRFWTQRPAVAAALVPAAEAPHGFPLRRIFLPLREKVFESVLRADSPGFLGDHRVQGSVVLPATAYLEMALAAAEQIFGPGQHWLEGIEFAEPLVLREGEPEIVQLVLTPGEANEARFEVRRREVGEPGSDEIWRLHASGAIRARVRPDAQKPLALSATGARCAEEIPAAEYYERLSEQGLEYGNSFRGLVNIRRAPGEALGQIELPEPLRNDVAGYHCHPALLDAALQVAAAGLDDAFVARGQSVPVAIERFSVYRRPGWKAWAHGLVRQTTDGGGASSDVQLVDADGEVLADVRGLQVRQTSRTQKRNTSQIAKWIYEIEWRQRDLNAAPARHSPRKWVVLSDRGGMGRALADALEATGDSCSLIPDTPCFGVIDLRSLDYTAPESALDVCASALQAVQALAARGDAPAPRLYLITRGAQATGPEKEPVTLAQAPLWGLGAVVPLEHPDLNCTRVDLDPNHETDAISALGRELRSDDREDRVAWRGGHRFVARFVKRTGPGDRPMRLEQTQPGVLGGLEFKPVPLPSPGPGEVTIRVQATGLNFRDVLNALGMYSGDAGPLGDECAGTVIAVGPDVRDCAVGDEVMALASGCFDTHVTTARHFVVARPKQLTPEMAAGIPIAFLTASYGLKHLARLAPRERVLIHAAGGGVGLAAVRVAQKIGAEIFATAGSEEKRTFLEAQGVRHVFDSRSLNFADEIRKVTGGLGVDVVLNSLSAEFIKASLEVLGPRGRFIEIGKRDIWTGEQVSAVRPNAEYHPFQLGDLMRTDPAMVGTLLRGISTSIVQGELALLPKTEFLTAEVVDAFRFMAQARHIGKIVVTQGSPKSGQVRDDGTYLVTGGLGALGLRTAEWLVSRGARHLVMVGRGGPNVDASAIVSQLESRGVRVMVVAADVSRREDVNRVLMAIDESTEPPLRGIFHAAGVLDDGALLQQDRNRFARVMAPKVDGAWNLHALTRERPLDFFVVFSSIVALAGSAGQSNYAAANAFLDALAHYRRAQGLPALSVNWGAWAEAGMAAQASTRDRRRWSDQGITAIAPEQGMQALEELLACGATQAAVLPIEWNTFLRQFSQSAEPPFYAEVPRGIQARKHIARSPSLLERLSAETLPHKRRQLIAAHVRDQVVQVLGLDPAQPIDTAQPIRDMGLDSLMAVEIRNALGLPFGEKLHVALLYDYPTVDALTEYLVLKFAGLQDQAAPSALVPVPDARARIDQASEEEIEELLLKELEDLKF